MNLKWLKQHALALGFGAVFLVVLGVLIWLQQVAASRRAGVDAALEEQRSQYEHLQEQKPAPTRESIDVIKQDREQLVQLYGDLLGKVSRTPDIASDLRPVDFLQLLASSFARLRQAASASGTKVQDNFAFGFERYAGQVPTLPARNLSPEQTKRTLTLLVKQLNAIDQISLLLMSNRVDEITQIHRAEAEPGGTTAAMAGGSLESAMKVNPNALYEVLPFEFQFKCNGDALRDFLNSLTKADLFFAVRDVQVAGEMPNTGGTASAPVGLAPVAAASAGSKPDLLTVNMRIDLIEFATPKPTKKAAGA